MSDSDKKTDPMDVANLPVGGAVESGEDPKGNEPMTEKQAAELRGLCEKHDEAFNAAWTRDQAAARIKALKQA